MKYLIVILTIASFSFADCFGQMYEKGDMKIHVGAAYSKMLEPEIHTDGLPEVRVSFEYFIFGSLTAGIDINYNKVTGNRDFNGEYEDIEQYVNGDVFVAYYPLKINAIAPYVKGGVIFDIYEEFVGTIFYPSPSNDYYLYSYNFDEIGGLFGAVGFDVKITDRISGNAEFNLYNFNKVSAQIASQKLYLGINVKL